MDKMKMNELLESGKYSDFTIKCSDKTFDVHKNIICPQSEYFSRLCDSTFKEGTENLIDLKEDDPKMILKMLKFMYTGEYTDDFYHLSEKENDEYPRFPDSTHNTKWLQTPEMEKQYFKDVVFQAQNINITMYSLAEKYMIPALKDTAQNYFTRVNGWSDASVPSGRDRWYHYATPVLVQAYQQIGDGHCEIKILAVLQCASRTSLVESAAFWDCMKEHSDIQCDILSDLVRAQARIIKNKEEFERRKSFKRKRECDNSYMDVLAWDDGRA